MGHYAHSITGTGRDEWQDLSEHLLGVAARAESFASRFDAGQWGYRAGILHDAGKATSAFLRRLEGSPERVDHSTYGARLAQERAGRLGLLLSYIVAGHHGGLPNGGEQEGQLHYRLKYAGVPQDIHLLPEADFQESLVPPFRLSRDRAGFNLAFFTRMIFSCLVDADFLDTEAFCAPDRVSYRPPPQPENLFGALKKSLDKHLEEKIRGAADTPVNRLRQSILAQCRKKAALDPGFFSLTVPTGGGKTLSSLAFALEHALAHPDHGLRRVIYAIPFTSIIEQNARAFEEVLGRENVLEHHCNYRDSEEPDDEGSNRRRGLAAENWDAPVVVTTNVQFFESLFSNRPSRCRKLHNIAGSVIILDEAQAIPTEYLEPCLAALQELVEHYRCTVVLCTATQPALDDRNSLRAALPQVEEIIDQPIRLYEELRRTEVTFLGKVSDADLAERLAGESQALCIVSTKRQARILFEMVHDTEDLFHLSTNMYPLHRRKILTEIRNRLQEGKRCRVISTSLVEAGVDLDFPVVYRAMAGLDSIAQAAGRCNREGKMEELGRVYVFESESAPRMPWPRRCMSRASETLRVLPGADPLGLEAMRKYFELLYDIENLDRKGILKLFPPPSSELSFPFREVSETFRFIEEETIGVVVAIEPQARDLVQKVEDSAYPRGILRELQQYTVGLRARDYGALEAVGALKMFLEEIPVLHDESFYREDVGLFPPEK